MHLTDDIQDALVRWEMDDTQWIITNGIQYVVCHEPDAVYALTLVGWEITSPEELARKIEA